MNERIFSVILFSLIFAFLVWASVNFGNQFQISIDVPLKIEYFGKDAWSSLLCSGRCVHCSYVLHGIHQRTEAGIAFSVFDISCKTKIDGEYI